MIRKFCKADKDSVAEIWLDTNLKAHSFIPVNYWKDNFEMVKELLWQAEVYVYEEESQIKGFIGLNGDYIEGIFVRAGEQSKGIGKQLMDFVKGFKNQLALSVYQKNVRALQFYQKEGFQIQFENMEENTGEKEYKMGWRTGS